MKKEELEKQMKKHADDFYIKLNPDKNRLDWIFEKLLSNEKSHGAIYCPCRAITGDKKRDSLIICPCVFHMGEVELKGECLCKLFVRA